MSATADQRLAVDLAEATRDVTAAIMFRMEEHQISRADLARKMGVSPSRVTQILSGDENLTLRTVVAAAGALGAKLQVDIVDGPEMAAPQPSPVDDRHPVWS